MIDCIGLDELFERLEDLGDTSNLEKAMGKAAAFVEGEARENAPKGDTGDLKKFMSSRVEHDGDNILGVVFNPLEYAPYVEYGTGLFAEVRGRTDVPWQYYDEKTGEFIWTYGIHPMPYMRPALNDNRETVLRLLQEGLTNGKSS